MLELNQLLSLLGHMSRPAAKRAHGEEEEEEEIVLEGEEESHSRAATSASSGPKSAKKTRAERCDMIRSEWIDSA